MGRYCYQHEVWSTDCPCSIPMSADRMIEQLREENQRIAKQAKIEVLREVLSLYLWPWTHAEAYDIACDARDALKELEGE